MLLSIHEFAEYLHQISRRFFELSLIAVERLRYLCKYTQNIAKHQVIAKKYMILDYRCRKRRLGCSKYV